MLAWLDVEVPVPSEVATEVRWEMGYGTNDRERVSGCERMDTWPGMLWPSRSPLTSEFSELSTGCCGRGVSGGSIVYPELYRTKKGG